MRWSARASNVSTGGDGLKFLYLAYTNQSMISLAHTSGRWLAAVDGWS